MRTVTKEAAPDEARRSAPAPTRGWLIEFSTKLDYGVAAGAKRFEPTSYNLHIDARPVHLDLKKDRGLTVQWSDGSTSYYSIAYLRKMSPSADARELRAEMARNPLTVLPSSMAGQSGPLTAIDAEFVGNYAIRIRFSDGHDTGIYSWRYLREIDPASQGQTVSAPRSTQEQSHLA